MDCAAAFTRTGGRTYVRTSGELRAGNINTAYDPQAPPGVAFYTTILVAHQAQRRTSISSDPRTCYPAGSVHAQRGTNHKLARVTSMIYDANLTLHVHRCWSQNGNHSSSKQPSFICYDNNLQSSNIFLLIIHQFLISKKLFPLDAAVTKNRLRFYPWTV